MKFRVKYIVTMQQIKYLEIFKSCLLIMITEFIHIKINTINCD